MTVLSSAETAEQPPRKKLCLSASRQLKSKSYARSQLNPMASPLDQPVIRHIKQQQQLQQQQQQLNCSCDNESNEPPGVATLCNLGNTCFLNSVLYTLRFAPSFLHNLHHLITELQEITGRSSNGLKGKCSSLGRSTSSVSSKMWNFQSTLNVSLNDLKIIQVTERLHQVFEALHNSELKDSSDPYQPEVFLQSLRDVNPIFEGNQQHDAHELLVCLLDNIREGCKLVMQHSAQMNCFVAPAPVMLQPAPNKLKKFSGQVRKSLKIASSSKTRPVNGSLLPPSVNNISSDKVLPENENFVDDKQIYVVNGTSNAILSEESESIPSGSSSSSCSSTSMFDDFQGVSLLRTTCLECEFVTERKESFCDICVPINGLSNGDISPEHEFNHYDYDSVNKLYHSAIVTEEYLQDTDKYWCEQCCRYNEAKRSVGYESLPRLLTLHLKRFCTNYRAVVSKVNEHMPTPLTLECFCEECLSLNSQQRTRAHSYQLYAIIMHLGATIASGHYVAYVKAQDNLEEYDNCPRDRRKTGSLSVTPNGTLPANYKKSSISNGLFRFLKISSKTSSSSSTSESPSSDSIDSGKVSSIGRWCRSLECCGIRILDNSEGGDSVWLECDDETVRTMSVAQLTQILESKSSKNSALTPYLLFYVKVNQNE